MRIIPVFLRQVFNTCDIQRRTDTGGIKLHDRIYCNLAALPLPVDPGKQYAEQIPPPLREFEFPQLATGITCKPHFCQ